MTVAYVIQSLRCYEIEGIFIRRIEQRDEIDQSAFEPVEAVGLASYLGKKSGPDIAVGRPGTCIRIIVGRNCEPGTIV
jgi:hypothetical protein